MSIKDSGGCEEYTLFMIMCHVPIQSETSVHAYMCYVSIHVHTSIIKVT